MSPDSSLPSAPPEIVTSENWRGVLREIAEPHGRTPDAQYRNRECAIELMISTLHHLAAPSPAEPVANMKSGDSPRSPSWKKYRETHHPLPINEMLDEPASPSIQSSPDLPPLDEMRSMTKEESEEFYRMALKDVKSSRSLPTELNEAPPEFARRLAVYLFDIDGYDALPDDQKRICNDAAEWAQREFTSLRIELASLKKEQLTQRISGVTWLLIRNGSVVLERCPKKAKVLGVGEWFVPGGKLEGDESPEQALIREVGEEWPGLTLLGCDPLPIVEGSPVPPTEQGIFLMRPFIISAAGAPPAQSADGIELKWTPLSEALASPVPQVRMMVAAALSTTGSTK